MRTFGVRLALSLACVLGACSSSGPPASSPASATASTTQASPPPSSAASCEHGAGAQAQPGPNCEYAVNPAAATPAPTAAENGAQRFGAASDPSLVTVALDDLLAAPQSFSGRSVKTSGIVHRVCQRMGCWMELRSESSERVVRVPMAGHGFFLPRDAGGKHAVVEGRVVMQELSAAQRQHYESEGATHTSAPFALHAASVELR